MLELRIVSGGTPRPLFDLPALLGRRNAAREIGDAIESLIAFMDELSGDPDMEEDDPAGGDIVDEPHDAEEDTGAEDFGEEGADWRHEAPDCDPVARRWHRDRIRAERCDTIPAGSGLYREPYPTWRIRGPRIIFR